MRFYKYIQDNYIVSIGTGASGEEITAEEYEALLAVIRSKPTPPDGYDYRLRADTLEWEEFELPPIEDEEVTADELLRELEAIL